MQGEHLIYKPGKGAFYNTDMGEWLKANAITHLLFAGVTTEASMRDCGSQIEPGSCPTKQHEVGHAFARGCVPV